MSLDVASETEKFQEETKDYIAKIRALHVKKDSPTFQEACKKLGIHESELQLK